MNSASNRPPKPNDTGCVPAFLHLIAILLAVLSTAGYIMGLYGKKLRFKGMDMGLVDLPMYLGILGMAAIFFGVGVLTDFLVKKQRAKKEKS